MTNQEAFNIVAKGMLSQGRKSMIDIPDIDGGRGCAYRGDDGCKCAFGFLIPDTLYDPAMENKRACVILDSYPEVAKAVDGVSHDLIGRLQSVHDKCAAENWRSRLATVAADFNLEMPV